MPSAVIINAHDALGKYGENITLHLRMGIDVSENLPARLMVGMVWLALVLSI